MLTFLNYYSIQKRIKFVIKIVLSSSLLSYFNSSTKTPPKKKKNLQLIPDDVTTLITPFFNPFTRRTLIVALILKKEMRKKTQSILSPRLDGSLCLLYDDRLPLHKNKKKIKIKINRPKQTLYLMVKIVMKA